MGVSRLTGLNSRQPAVSAPVAIASKPKIPKVRVNSAVRDIRAAAIPGAPYGYMEHFLNIPLSVLTDSYKATHFLQYPASSKMVAYGEFRAGFEKDKTDTRLVVYGIRYIVENYISKRWTMDDIHKADLFYKSHLSPSYGPFTFPRALFEKFVKENDGYFPVTIEALPEGTCAHVRVPVYQIRAEGEYAPLCTFLETLLTMIWYPTCVATLSRRARDLIEAAFERTSDGGASNPLVSSRLHDFGFRGCTSVEQSVIGGCAHLLNFEGTDTLSAAYYAQFTLNEGRPVAQSVPATEHSVMTAWPSERAAVENMIQHFGTGIFSCVMDSYNYAQALSEMLPEIKDKKVAKGGVLVLRPDSGDPVEAVLMALKAGEAVFGTSLNGRGYKVINKCAVIQGDGINSETLLAISLAVQAAGFAADNVAYGMGGGLLQKVNRDTMSFATKLNHIVYADGTKRDVMKQPQTDPSKFSLPGVLSVKRVNGIPTVFPRDSGEVAPDEDMLRVVYDMRPLDPAPWEHFDALRQRVASEWAALPHTAADNLSPSLRKKVQQQLAAHGKASAVPQPVVN